MLGNGDALPHQVKTVARRGSSRVNISYIAALNLVEHLAI